ncbi:MAG: lipid-A-disaccharide synthase [Thioalkalivibrio sp.]
MSDTHVMVVAGEASGDLHAANMVRAMRRLRPTLRFSGMGGGALRDAGVDILVDSTRLSVVGLVEVLAHYGDIRRALKTLKTRLEQERPALLVLVDYVEFNLRLARYAKGLGVKVLFYVSPQVWAWRARRVKRIGQAIDAMAVLFPFEEAVYRQHGIPVRYVGNPLVDEVRASTDCYALRRGFGLNETAPVVGILPGSRRGELGRHLPLIMEAARLLKSRIPKVQFIMPLAPGVDVEGDVNPHLDTGLGIVQVTGRTYDAMHASDALMIASGTATLEAGLLRVPMAILYRVSPITYAILKRLILIRDIGLANIVAGERVVPEFVQNDATPEAIAGEIERLLTDIDYARHMRERLGIIREKLGEGGGSENVARMAMELIDDGVLRS